MDSEVDDTLVRDVARVVVARVAPAELPTFRVVSDAYLADQRRWRSGPGGETGPLAFGAGDAVVLVTPVALMVANEVTQHLVGEFVRAAVGRGRRAVTHAVRRVFGLAGKQPNSEDEDPSLELTSGQWAEVRRLVVDAARRGGLPDDTAELVGDAVVGAGQVSEDREN